MILVGEIRDLATIRTAITAAETGHLVFTTVHAGDCVGTIERLVSVFPADEQPGVRRQMALVLKAIVAQHLIVADGRRQPGHRERACRPCPRRRSRVVTSEVLIANPAVANLIATGKSEPDLFVDGNRRPSGHADAGRRSGPAVGQQPDFGDHGHGHGPQSADRARPGRESAGERSNRLICEGQSDEIDAYATAVLDMDQVKVDPAWALRVPASLATRRQVLPFAAIDGHVYVACANDQDHAALQAVERYVNMPVRAEAGRPRFAQAGLEPHLRQAARRSAAATAAPLIARTIDPRAAADPDSSDAVALCDELLYAAMVREASDIHIDPAESTCWCAFASTACWSRTASFPRRR